jgi:hypothetical protein
MSDSVSFPIKKSVSQQSDLPEELPEFYFRLLEYAYNRFPNMDKEQIHKIYNEVFEETFLVSRNNNISTWNFPKKTF